MRNPLDTSDVKENINDAEEGDRFWQDGNIFYKINYDEGALDWDWYIAQSNASYIKRRPH